jgi:hypothetical protein
VKAVIVLKNGTEIRADVEEITVSHGQLQSDLRGIKWKSPPGARTVLHWLDPQQVSAIYAEYEDGNPALTG